MSTGIGKYRTFPYEYRHVGEHPGASFLRRDGLICLPPPRDFVYHNWLQIVLVLNSGRARGTQLFLKSYSLLLSAKTTEFLQVPKN